MVRTGNAFGMLISFSRQLRTSCVVTGKWLVCCYWSSLLCTYAITHRI